MIAISNPWLFVGVAFGPGVELQWQASDGCPDAVAVNERLAALVGPRDGDVAVQASARVEPHGAGYRAAIHIDGGDARIDREVIGPSCAIVADAVAMVVAIHVDALAVVSTSKADAVIADIDAPHVVIPLPPAGAPTRQVRDTAAPRGTDAPAESARVRVAVRVGAGAALRQSPAATPALSLGTAVLLPRARFDLELGWTFAARARLPAPDRTSGADIATLHGAVQAAYVVRRGRFELPLGGGVLVGDMIAGGRGLPTARTRHAAWAAALVGPTFVFAPSRNLALWLGGALSLAFVRPTFTVAQGGDERRLYRPPVVGVRLAAGLEVRFR